MKNELNIFLLVMVVGAIVTKVAIIGDNIEPTARTPIQIDVGVPEAPEVVYELLYEMAATCDIEFELRVALENDGLIDVVEAETIGMLCVEKGISESNNPFERGQVYRALDYAKKGGIAM